MPYTAPRYDGDIEKLREEICELKKFIEDSYYKMFERRNWMHNLAQSLGLKSDINIDASSHLVLINDGSRENEMSFSTNSTKDQIVKSNTYSSNIEELLSTKTTREKESKRINEEIIELVNMPSVKERKLNERFRSLGGSRVRQFCAYGTRAECNKRRILASSCNSIEETCNKLHFIKIIQPHTDESLGDCSFLNTCFHIDTCKYVHYKVDEQEKKLHTSSVSKPDSSNNSNDIVLFPPQWICCDLRKLDMSVLGKFSVIMADPPWDIHMELPYGTMSDNEMRQLDIPILQDDGYIFLWVTGRAMELGRECLMLWGYRRVDEIIWVKTNQLQRLIRTGRTGHWLNHGKEHCLVGIKGFPKSVNIGIDCDVIVSEVRETSHKPDEIYGLIERLSPGTRKLELFGRPHNVQPNWITLGNQLEGTCLVDPLVVSRFKKRYPNGIDDINSNSKSCI